MEKAFQDSALSLALEEDWLDLGTQLEGELRGYGASPLPDEGVGFLIRNLGMHLSTAPDLLVSPFGIWGCRI